MSFEEYRETHNSTTRPGRFNICDVVGQKSWHSTFRLLANDDLCACLLVTALAAAMAVAAATAMTAMSVTWTCVNDNAYTNCGRAAATVAHILAIVVSGSQFEQLCGLREQALVRSQASGSSLYW
jgi:hypothetical protein